MLKIFTTDIENDLSGINHLIKDLNQFLKAHQILGRRLYYVNLVIEESLVNIIKYNSKNDALFSIHVEVEIHPEEISVLIIYNGKPFNPLSVPHMDIRKPVMERPFEGMGMHLVRNVMRSMWYERKAEKNFFQIQIER